ncbi:LysR family transcriptional regulator [Planococcus glaciei]|uniref:LysR family transcriptional regulator n=1 Tax=Planococcus glaciei TaxID=459472 RepID=A0A7H8Q7R3_9BACL|nr:LysR family transcriptional regulator [Planococcus glaciei]QKX49532.1 LysR family transcriptional regulator [Planococcus glaciei]
MTIEPKILQYVLTLVEEKNFTKAAKKLHLAQPSLSYQITKLEKDLGVQLFIREYNEVVPTYAGSVFVSYATNILNQYRYLKNEIIDISELKKGSLTIGSLVSAGAHLLPNAISAFRKEFPGIDLKLVEDTSHELQDMVASGKIEICLLSLPIKNHGIETENILEEDIYLAVPPDHWLSAYQEVELSMCREEPFIALKNTNTFRTQSDELCQEAGFAPNIVFESTNINTCQSLVLADIGITIVPQMFLDESELKEKPKYLPFTINGKRPKRTLVVGYKNIGYVSKASRAFIEILKNISQ